MQTAFVVTCNDSVEAVVLGTLGQADKIKQQLCEAHFERTPHHWPEVKPRNWNSLTRDQRALLAWEGYRQQMHWAVREVPLHSPG